MARLQRRNIQHIFAPDKGLAQNMAPTLIPERNCPNCSNVKFRFGEVSKASGYVKFGSDGQPLSWDGTAGLRVMALPDFKLLDSTIVYLALTLEDAFVYDAGGKRWRAMGRVAEDCEDAWTLAAEVTQASDTGQVGTNCRKFTATSSYTKNAMFAYENIPHANQDYSAYNKVHFWIKSTLAQDAGDLILRFAQDDALGGTTASVNVPALAAATWYYMHVDLALTSITSCDSVGLVTSTEFDDTVTQTIWIDDIRASTKFNNAKTDQWTWCSQAGSGTTQETAPTWFLMMTNGVDIPYKWNGSDEEFSQITGTLSSGDPLIKSKVTISYKDTLGFMNNTENVNKVIPQRFRFGDTAEEDDWTTGVAGHIDNYDTPGGILAATILGPYLVLYKSDGIVLVEYNSAATPVYDKTPRITGTQFFATKLIASANNIDYFLARDNVYMYSGLHETVKIGDPVRDELLGELDFSKKFECFAFIQPGKHRITFVTPAKATATQSYWYTYDFMERTWTKGKWADYMTCAGNFEGGSAITWGQATGTWADAVGTWADVVQEREDKTILLGDKDGFVYQLADTLREYDGSAINASWDTKDFALSPDYMNRNMRYGKVSYAGRGDQVSVRFSTDEGNTWTVLATDQILTAQRTEYKISLNFSTFRCRFQFYDNTIGKNFYISQVAIEYMMTTTRD